MCIAIVTKPGARITQQQMISSARANGDGGGFAYIDKNTGEVVITKGFMKVEEFIPAYEKMIAEGHHETSPVLVHFRIGTLGKVDESNTHPFALKCGGAVIHNGTLWSAVGGGSPRSCELSDTHKFALELSDKVTPEILEEKRTELERVVAGNRIAFLFKDRKYVILNEKMGNWEGDVWYSNGTHKAFR